MKVRSFLFGMLCMLALSASFTSCSDDNDDLLDDGGSTVALPQVRAYFLNEGTMGENNASIAFYAPAKDADFISDIFKKQNNAKLGDVGQDMIAYDDEIYVSVYGSNYLAKLNAAGVEQKRISFVEDADLSAGIRFIDAEDGYIYASFYGGAVAKINAKTLQVEKKLTGIGNNLEGVAVSDNKLYVANSYAMVGTGVVYKKEVFVVDLNTFTLKETLTVEQNPNMLVEENDKIFLISWNYDTESYVLQLIEPRNANKITQLGYATNMAAEDDMLYLVDSRTDYSQYPVTTTVNTFRTYNVKTGMLSATSFLKDAPVELTSTSISLIQVNEKNGDIYIGTTFYSASNGTIYRFKKDGTFMEQFDCGGLSPRAAVFFN